MANFAKLNKHGFVIAVLPLDDSIIIDPETGDESEELGIAYLKEWSGGHPWWVQTSYNTCRGNHVLGKNPLRKNYARLGGTYDSIRDIFVDPKIKDNDIFDEATGSWISSNTKPLENQNGPMQVETDYPITENLDSQTWDWDPDKHTWYLKN